MIVAITSQKRKAHIWNTQQQTTKSPSPSHPTSSIVPQGEAGVVGGVIKNKCCSELGDLTARKGGCYRTCWWNAMSSAKPSCCCTFFLPPPGYYLHPRVIPLALCPIGTQLSPPYTLPIAYILFPLSSCFTRLVSSLFFQFCFDS